MLRSKTPMHSSLSQAIRQRLAAFQHSLPASPDIGPSVQSGLRSSTSSSANQPTCAWFDRAEVVENEAGEHLRILVPMEELWPECHRPLARHRTTKTVRDAGVHPELAAMAAELPRGTLLLDLETGGFAGSAIFLIGLVRQVQNRLSVDLLLARNYAEERAILVTLRAAIDSCGCLVTFNGKSFDWPMVRDRSILHHLDPDRWPPRIHCDLLHHARRRWRKILSNCRLQTLETYVCGRHRTDDLPGSAIPEVYHDYVRSGRTDRLTRILHHNALDLVTLLDLALRMTRGS